MAATAKEPWKWQARYDALSWWSKFLFHQNPRQWVDAWKNHALAARVEALEKFAKRVKDHFDRHGINSDGDLRLQEAARKLLEGK